MHKKLRSNRGQAYAWNNWSRGSRWDGKNACHCTSTGHTQLRPRKAILVSLNFSCTVVQVSPLSQAKAPRQMQIYANSIFDGSSMYSCKEVSHVHGLPEQTDETYLDLHQCSYCFSSIEQAVVVSQSEIHHLSNQSVSERKQISKKHTGRISTLPLIATGRSLIACRPSTAV